MVNQKNRLTGEELLTESEAALFLGVNRITLSRWAKAGIIHRIYKERLIQHKGEVNCRCKQIIHYRKEEIVALEKKAAEKRYGRVAAIIRQGSPFYGEPDKLRRKLNLNTNQFALLVGVDPRTVSYWYRKKKATRGTHAAFMQALDRCDSTTVDKIRTWALEGGIEYVFKKLVSGIEKRENNVLVGE